MKKDLQMVALKSEEKMIKNVLIKQVHKFQNSFFKERMLKAATATKSHIVSEYATKYALLLKLN